MTDTSGDQPTEELMRETLTECEMMINSRPLTQVDLQYGNLESSLTPNHFILGQRSKTIWQHGHDPKVLKNYKESAKK